VGHQQGRKQEPGVSPRRGLRVERTEVSEPERVAQTRTSRADRLAPKSFKDQFCLFPQIVYFFDFFVFIEVFGYQFVVTVFVMLTPDGFLF
jgi:hypothetical protein